MKTTEPIEQIDAVLTDRRVVNRYWPMTEWIIAERWTATSLSLKRLKRWKRREMWGRVTLTQRMTRNQPQQSNQSKPRTTHVNRQLRWKGGYRARELSRDEYAHRHTTRQINEWHPTNARTDRWHEMEQAIRCAV